MVFRCIISFLTVASECTKGIMQSSTQPNFLKMVWNWNIHQRYNLIKDDDWWHQLLDTRLFYLSQTKTNFWWHRQLHLSVEFTGQILKFTPCLELYKLEQCHFELTILFGEFWLALKIVYMPRSASENFVHWRKRFSLNMLNKIINFHKFYFLISLFEFKRKYERNIRGVFKTHSNIFDGAFLRK